MLDEEDRTVNEGLGVLEAGAGGETLRVGELFLIPAHTGVTRQAHDDIWHHTSHRHSVKQQLGPALLCHNCTHIPLFMGSALESPLYSAFV